MSTDCSRMSGHVSKVLALTTFLVLRHGGAIEREARKNISRTPDYAEIGRWISTVSLPASRWTSSSGKAMHREIQSTHSQNP